MIPLTETEEIKLTMARYYTPSDTNIDKIGIPPDLEAGYPDFTEDDEKAYLELIKSNAVEEYVEAHQGKEKPEITACAAELKKTYNLDERLLRRLIRIKAVRTQSNRLYDLDYDIQLNKALEVLNTTADFNKLVASTKTQNEIQKEAEMAASSEKKAVSSK